MQESESSSTSDTSSLSLSLTNSSLAADDAELPSPSPLHSISLHPKNHLRATVVAYVCVTVGAGIISLPLAIAEAGWVGILLIALTSLLCVQTANWLIECMHVGHPTLSTYEDIGIAAMGPAGKLLVALVQNITLFGVCCIFLIIAGGNLSALLPQLSLHGWVLVLGALLVPVSWLKTVKEIKPLAYFGLFASLLVGGVVVLKGLQTYATAAPPLTATYSPFRASGLFTCINIVVFALGAHAVIPNQVNEMRHARRDYRRFTAYSYALIASVYIVVAACGYAGYSEEVQDNVLNSIDPPPHVDQRTHVLTQVARLFISLHVLLAYPLPLNPVSLFLESQLGVPTLSPPRQLLPRLLLRSALVLCTVFIASVVPYFGSILSLVSALSIIATAFVLPPTFYFLLYRRQRKFGYWEMARLLLTVVVGVLCLVIGVYYAVTGLVDDIRTHPNPFDKSASYTFGHRQPASSPLLTVTN